jgi:hypothetical protein
MLILDLSYVFQPEESDLLRVHHDGGFGMPGWV